jgi:putative transposase
MYRLFSDTSLARAFGCARVVFNDGLRARQDAHAAGLPYLPDGVLLKLVTTDAKRTPQRAWLGEVSAVVLQQAVADLNAAYRNFFNSLSGKRKGRKVAPPRFRSKKDSRQSIRFTRNSKFRITTSGRLSLPKIGDVSVRWSRDLPCEPSSATVTLDAAGRYHASFVVEVTDQSLPVSPNSVGIDLGLSTFAALSDGRKLDNPRFARKAEKRLARAQRALSRCQRGSKNRAKARVKVAHCHAKVRDTRRNWLHQESTRIIRDNQAVYVEDLSVAGLARTRMARSVHDAGWSTFVGMLEYKAARAGRTFARIDRWFPSTRTCSTCGAVGEKKPLHVRSWTCPCGAVHDRDVNAAINILAAGRADRPTPVELMSAGISVPQSALKQEPAGSAACAAQTGISAL